MGEQDLVLPLSLWMCRWPTGSVHVWEEVISHPHFPLVEQLLFPWSVALGRAWAQNMDVWWFLGGWAAVTGRPPLVRESLSAPFGLLCSLQLRGSAPEQHCLQGWQERHGLSKTVLNFSWGSSSVKPLQGKAGIKKYIWIFKFQVLGTHKRLKQLKLLFFWALYEENDFLVSTGCLWCQRSFVLLKGKEIIGSSCLCHSSIRTS